MSNSRRPRIVRLEGIRQEGRGALAVASYGRHVPFVVRRTFLIHEVPTGIVRGSHAHHRCEQFLLCVHGSCRVLLDDGVDRCEIFPRSGALIDRGYDFINEPVETGECLFPGEVAGARFQLLKCL